MIKREDIIVDPKDPRVEGLIGKKVYMGNSFIALNNEVNTPCTLESIKYNSNPFRSGAGYGYIMIAPVPKPTYRPFKSAEEFEPFRDNWIIERSSQIRMKIFQYEKQGAVVYNSLSSWRALFEYMAFEDGTPFGIKEKS